MGGDGDGNGAASHPLISVYVYDRRNTGTLDWMRAGSNQKKHTAPIVGLKVI
jgi:hypothetical protein